MKSISQLSTQGRKEGRIYPSVLIIYSSRVLTSPWGLNALVFWLRMHTCVLSGVPWHGILASSSPKAKGPDLSKALSNFTWTKLRKVYTKLVTTHLTKVNGRTEDFEILYKCFALFSWNKWCFQSEFKLQGLTKKKKKEPYYIICNMFSKFWTPYEYVKISGHNLCEMHR